MMLKEEHSHKIIALVVFAISVVCITTCGSWGVIETSEARYAEIAREMFRKKEFLHPTLLSIHHYHKPPLTYWITDVGFWLFGVNEFGARFFLQLALITQTFTVYKLSVLLFDKLIALFAAIIYLSFPIVLVSSRGLTTDAYLNTFVMCSIYLWCCWKSNDKPVWLYASFLSLGLAFFSKGPVALLIPLSVMIGLNGCFTRKKENSIAQYVIAIIIFMVIGFSWFAYLILNNPLFIDYFFVHHTVERFAHADLFTRKQPWWYFLAFAPLVAVPGVMAFGFKRNSEKAIPKFVKRIAVFWIAIPLVFFSISSSKLILYVLPLYPGIAILCSWYFTNRLKSKEAFSAAMSYFISVIALIMIIGFFFVAELRNINAGLACIVILACILVIRKKRFDAFTSVLTFSFLWLLLLIIPSTLFLSNHELKSNSTKPIADWIRKNNLDYRRVFVYNVLLPSLAFDLDKDIISIADGNRYLEREVQFESDSKWQQTFYDLRKPDDMKRLEVIISQPCLILVKGDIPVTHKWLIKNYRHQKQFEKWVLFYN